MKKFNLIDYVNLNNTFDSKDKIVSNIQHPFARYHQRFNVDFTLKEIESFIKDHFFLGSNISKNDKDDTIALHIRNGDYVGTIFDCFNRTEYLNKCFSLIDHSISKIVIFSDDINYVKKNYIDCIKNRFDVVLFSGNTNSIDDFIDLCSYKNKILWNSTFSYWAAFIGNVIYENSYDKIFAPSIFVRSEPLVNRVNPLWRNICVSTN